MVTRPKPIWERWMETEKGRERIYKLYYIAMLLLQLFIVVGIIMFFVFLLAGK